MWIVYFTVPDLDASLREVAARGGEVLNGPRNFGAARYALIRDPAGACCALFQPE
jgi:predicted enzyme related to lactoylglutathione lyase